MARYRKKPVVIEAFQWTGDVHQSEDPEWIVDAMKQKVATIHQGGTEHVCMLIRTPEGTKTANRGDWIIKDVNGEIYPCKPDIFEKTYASASSKFSIVS